MTPFPLRSKVLESNPMKTHDTLFLAPSALIAASDSLFRHFEGCFFL
jgi:hypothetical protein